jgi:hypothetical protein
MKIKIWIIAGLISFLLSAGPLLAEEKKQTDLPWEKAWVSLGWYWANLDSGFKLSSQNIGMGISIDVEDAFDLKTDDSALRLEAGWRFTKNKRHKLALSWFRFDREGTRTVDEAIEIPDGEGGETTIGPGQIKSTFNFDIYQLKYEYSFILDDRFDLNAGVGLFIMPVEFGLEATVNGAGQESLFEDVTAPLPVIGLGFDFAITPKWFLRQQFDLFYLEIDQFKGGILANSFAIEYLPWKHVGFGFGLDAMRIGVEAEDEDYPGIDFNGSFEFSYIGAQLYLKVFM